VARQGQSTITWIESDVARWSPSEQADLIVSNAALHWLDDHSLLLARLIGYLRPGSVLAMQMPRNHGSRRIPRSSRRSRPDHGASASHRCCGGDRWRRPKATPSC
jgi:trans-aconitate methyltransferase